MIELLKPVQPGELKWIIVVVCFLIFVVVSNIVNDSINAMKFKKQFYSISTMHFSQLIHNILYVYS